MLLDFGGSLTCRCVGCGAERELPEPDSDKPRLPARSQPGEGVTLEADDPCPGCRKSSRVRLKLEFDEGPEDDD